MPAQPKWIENLQYAVEVFDEGGEVLASARPRSGLTPLTRRVEPSIRGSCCTCSKAGGSCGEGIVTSPTCARCDDTFWVCERHDDRPSDCCTPEHPRACTCGAPRMPCPDCNARSDPRDPPKMPPGFTVTVDDKGPRN
jgi:hypothetical protein